MNRSNSILVKRRFIPSFILFLINPLLTIIVLAVEGFQKGKTSINIYNQHILFIFGSMCCVFVSLINMMKEPEIDLAAYVYSYRLAAHYDLSHYLLVGSHDTAGTYKDPLFYALVWIMNRLYLGNIKLFIFSLSIIEYSFFVSSMIYLGKAIKSKLFVTMVCITILCFFPYIFTHTMNVVRQTIANGIICFIAVRHFFYGKKDWFLILSATLIHSTAFLFVPLLLFPAYKKTFSDAKIWYLALIAGLFIIKASATYLFVAGDFDITSTIGYALARAQEGSRGSFGQLRVSDLVITLVAIIYSFYLFLQRRNTDFKGITGFSFVLFFLSLFILLNIDEHQISGRFHHYLMTMMPYFLLIYLTLRDYKGFAFLFIISVLTICLFTIYLHVGLWTYHVIAGGWLMPVIGYII